MTRRANKRTDHMRKMLVTIVGCAVLTSCATSTGGTASPKVSISHTPKASTEGCFTAADAESTFHRLAQGLHDQTVTADEAAAKFGSISSQMRQASDIASGPLQAATHNAAVVAGRLHVALATGNTSFDSGGAVGVLQADIGRIDSICS